jgi:hypothetical protein
MIDLASEAKPQVSETAALGIALRCALRLRAISSRVGDSLRMNEGESRFPSQGSRVNQIQIGEPGFRQIARAARRKTRLMPERASPKPLSQTDEARQLVNGSERVNEVNMIRRSSYGLRQAFVANHLAPCVVRLSRAPFHPNLKSGAHQRYWHIRARPIHQEHGSRFGENPPRSGRIRVGIKSFHKIYHPPLPFRS